MPIYARDGSQELPSFQTFSNPLAEQRSRSRFELIRAQILRAVHLLQKFQSLQAPRLTPRRNSTAAHLFTQFRHCCIYSLATAQGGRG